ncbi:hypothetical protein [Actinophytocola gossypii]|uniref:Uncharacterized protein n=1 Tax=Actinophytocola gossypii TaxID=2812003 RepID=A0ABT2JHG0_9PSEU|nr:hypothetical protein [Actinophytocola gossypii]MCT2587315.1 hypothetical protein [Actinophytocola gossypii]
MPPWLVIVLVVAVLVAAAVVLGRRKPAVRPARSDRPPDVIDDLLALRSRLAADSDNPNVRRRQAMERAGRPLPDDPATAELVAGVRDRYRVGTGPWADRAADTRRDLEAAGETGLRAAAWIVARSVADLRWEVTFWTENAGLPPAADTRAGIAQLDPSDPNPYNTLSGLHPRIHLVAAVGLLTEHPRAEVTGELTDLLELWFAYAERQYHLRDGDIEVLQALVRCYLASPGPTHPAFVVELAGQDVTRPVVNVGQSFSHVENGITYVDPVFHDDGTFDLSALARAATSR